MICLLQVFYSILNHVFSSNRGEYGVTNVGKQELTLVQVSPHNDRVFDHSKAIVSYVLFRFIVAWSLKETIIHYNNVACVS